MGPGSPGAVVANGRVVLVPDGHSMDVGDFGLLVSREVSARGEDVRAVVQSVMHAEEAAATAANRAAASARAAAEAAADAAQWGAGGGSFLRFDESPEDVAAAAEARAREAALQAEVE